MTCKCPDPFEPIYNRCLTLATPGKVNIAGCPAGETPDRRSHSDFVARVGRCGQVAGLTHTSVLKPAGKYFFRLINVLSLMG